MPSVGSKLIILTCISVRILVLFPFKYTVYKIVNFFSPLFHAKYILESLMCKQKQKILFTVYLNGNYTVGKRVWSDVLFSDELFEKKP